MSTTTAPATSDLSAVFAGFEFPAAANDVAVPEVAEMRALLQQFHQLCKEQAEVIAEQARMLAHSRKIFARASEAAQIGVWECDLSDDSLTWTDVVYDIFDLPRGSAIDREQTLAIYEPQTRAILEAVRSRAISERGGFKLDAKIVTPTGNVRWIRITASVESENERPVRIFGMKQNITEEKLLGDRTRYLADFDPITGLANRTRFQSALADLEGSSAGVALLLVDLDGFKQVNDTLGHVAGDECLRISAQRLAETCAEAELVARVGGDEFAVLLAIPSQVDAAQTFAAGIVRALRQPIALPGGVLSIGASVGVALLDGGTTENLFLRADGALYEAKAGGRNGYRTAPPTSGN